jgi:flagellar secretion chaperone FliS
MAGFSNAAAARAYVNVGLESGVASAHPHRLIQMLFEGALLAVTRAKAAMAANNIPLRGASISKAIQIIEEGLKASLAETGSELAGNLRSLYEYMSCRLLVASLKNDSAALDEVTRLLTEIKEAWNAIDPEKR